MVVMPLLRVPGRPDATYDEFSQGDENEFRNYCYNCEEYRKPMTCYLPMYDELGLLD